MTNVNRPIPEIFIPKRRPKPPKPSKQTAAAERMPLEPDSREFREIDRLMRSNACPWL